MELTGRIQIERPPPEARGKTFLGAWLVEPGGRRWVVTYSPETPLRSVDGQVVKVRGRRCDPLYQALLAEHFLIETLEPLP